MKKFNAFMCFFFVMLMPIHAYSISNSKINDLARKFMQDNQVEGMSIAVIVNNKPHIFNYGLSDEVKKTPVTNDTIYTIASFSKTFTATLAAVASVENKLNLDESFISYFSELKSDKNLSGITSRMLLAHVSSFPFDFAPRPQTWLDIVNSFNQFKYQNTPGSEYQYSNAGIGTVGYVLQQVYAKKYQDILDDKISKPLNMNSTYLNVPAEKEQYIALGHEKNNKQVTYSKHIEAWFAAASLKSTITDMAKYLNAHINYASLPDKTLAKAMPIVHDNIYCFTDKISCEQLAWQAHLMSALKSDTGDTGFIDYDANGYPVFNKKSILKNHAFPQHNIFIDKTGSGYGMSSYMAYIPDEKVGIVILLNKGIGDERIKLGRHILTGLITGLS